MATTRDLHATVWYLDRITDRLMSICHSYTTPPTPAQLVELNHHSDTLDLLLTQFNNFLSEQELHDDPH